ncbi:Major pollen allergen Bet v 1-C [Linum perenne]
MGVTTATHEFKSSIPAERMYKAIVVENSTLFPKIVPQYKSEFIQGNGGVGSIRETCFPDEGGVKTVKHRVEAQDPANYYGKYTLIEGGPLSDKNVESVVNEVKNVESVVNEVKIEAVGDGCVCKATNHYHTKGDEADKAMIESTGQQTIALYKAVQDYLLANPTICA